MALGSLAIWTVIPLAWLWVTQEMSSGPRFLVTIAGCVVTMVSAGVLLRRVEAAYFRLSGAPAPEPRKPSWERTTADERGGGPRLGLLDTLLATSAVLALVALVLWWALIADSPNPSGPLQPL